MKIHFSSSRGKTKSNFSSRISRDRDSCQGLVCASSGAWSLEELLAEPMASFAVCPSDFIPSFGRDSEKFSPKCLNPELHSSLILCFS